MCTSLFPFARTLALAAVLIALSLPAPGAAQEGGGSDPARVDAIPAQGRVGTKVSVVAQDLVPSRTYDVVLVVNRTTDIDVGDATAGLNGVFKFPFFLPAGVATGAQEIQVRERVGLPPRPILGRTSFTVSAGLVVTPTTPITPRPGSRMSVGVSGLTSGSLELIYDGGIVYGPVSVSTTSVSVPLVLPTDRPANLPSAVQLIAINRIGRVAVNSGSATITVQPRSANPIQIGNVQVPGAIRPTVPVPMQGRLTREDGIRAGTEVDAYWHGNDGSIVPLPGNAVAFDANGNFVLNSSAPGLLSMTAGFARGPGEMRFIAREGAAYAGDVDVQYGDDNGGYSTNSSGRPQRLQMPIASQAVQAAQNAAEGLITVTVRSASGGVIPNAVVEIGPADNSPFSQTFLGAPAAEDQGRSGRMVNLMGDSQYTAEAAAFAQFIGVGPSPFESPDCPATLKRQVTDAQGKVQFQLNLDAIAELTGGIYCSSPDGPQDAGNCQPARAISFQITVYGGQVGFGHRDPQTEAYFPAKYHMLYLKDREFADANYGGAVFQFDPYDPRFSFDGNGIYHDFSPNFSVRLPPLPSPSVVVENINMQGLARESAPPTGGGLPPGSNAAAWFAPVVTVPLNAGTFASNNPTYHLFFSHSPLIGGIVTNASFWFDANNNGSMEQVGNFVFSANQRGQCGLTELDTFELPFGVSSSTLGGVFRYGLNGQADERVERCGEIRVTNQSGVTGKRQVCFQFAPMLISYLLNGDTDSLIYNDDVPGFLTYGGTLPDLIKSGSRDLDVPPVANGDGSGELENRSQENQVNNSVSVGGSFSSVGGTHLDTNLSAEEQRNYRGVAQSELITRNSANRQSSRDGESQGATQSLGAAATVTGSLDPITVLDISFPLFYYVWGISPIAGLEMGADMSILAQFIAYTKMQSTLDGDGNTAISLVKALAQQIVEIGIDFYADLDVMFDLVDAEIVLRPILCAGVRVEMPPPAGQNEVRELAQVRLVMDYLFSIWTPPPFPNVEVEDSVTLANEGDAECRSQARDALVDEKGAIMGAHPDRYRVALASDIPEAAQPDNYLAFAARTAPIVTPGPGDAGKTRVLVNRIGQPEIEIQRAYGIRHLALANYAPNRALLLWVQSADPPPSQPSNSRAVLAQIVSRQHIRYSRWNGTSWSAAQDLTPPGNGGEGGLSVAVCHDNRADCGSGKVLAVWTRSTSGDFRDLRTRVFRSEFTPASGGTWSTPVTLDGSGVNDSHATAIYAAGVPVVGWLRNSGGSVTSAKNRGLAYRVLDGSSPVRLASNIPAGISWPKLAVDSQNRIGLAFAAPEDSRALLGNRQAVHLSSINCAAGGNCAFTTIKLKDRRGRTLHAERPIPEWDNEGTLFVGYRGVSYGPDAAGTTRNYAEDPPGIRFKTGEAMMIASNLTSATVEPVALTNDGGGYSDIALAFNSISGTMTAHAVRSAGAAVRVTKRSSDFDIATVPAGAAKGIISENVISLERMHGPDLAIGDVRHLGNMLVPGGVYTVEVKLGNRGSAFAPLAIAATSLSAFWDNPSAMGGAAISSVLGTIEAGGERTIRLHVPVPSSFGNDEQHLLYLRIAIGTIDLVDADGSNNQRVFAVGGMPVPRDIWSSTQPDLPLARLEWTPVNQARVAGYRIYRQDDDGPIVPLGSSKIAAFVDLSARFGVPRTYYVTTYSARGVESRLSDPIPVMPVNLVGESVFGDGFESLP